MCSGWLSAVKEAAKARTDTCDDRSSGSTVTAAPGVDALTKQGRRRDRTSASGQRRGGCMRLATLRRDRQAIADGGEEAGESAASQPQQAHRIFAAASSAASTRRHANTTAAPRLASSAAVSKPARRKRKGGSAGEALALYGARAAWAAARAHRCRCWRPSRSPSCRRAGEPPTRSQPRLTCRQALPMSGEPPRLRPTGAFHASSTLPCASAARQEK
jgi:hypothetical protein